MEKKFIIRERSQALEREVSVFEFEFSTFKISKFPALQVKSYFCTITFYQHAILFLDEAR